MAYVGESSNIMKPKKGASKIYLPITFDYSGGRRDTNKGKIIWACIVGVLGLIFGLGTLFAKDGNFISNLVLGIGIMFVASLIIRFPILKEHKLRNEILEAQERDYKKTYDKVWGIFAMDDTYPYYAHMRNGKTAIFVRFDKDVILGKVKDSKHEHYEAISDAYNLAGSMGIGMCHIDYMDVIGNDERLDACFQSLPSIQNPDMRDLVTDIYTNLQEKMNEKVTTYDVYVYTFRSSEASFWYQIQKVFACMLDANYSSYKVLNADDLRSLPISLLNLHDFSVVEAMSQAFEMGEYKGVIPIKVITGGNEVIINKTIEEKKEEAKIRAKEEALKKEANRKKKKKSISQDEEIDIFGDD